MINIFNRYKTKQSNKSKTVQNMASTEFSFFFNFFFIKIIISSEWLVYQFVVPFFFNTILI